MREQKEKVYQSLNEADMKALKQELQGEAVYHSIATSINSKRKVAAFVNQLPVTERLRWIEEWGLHGLVELPEPPREFRTAPLPQEIPIPAIADIDEESVQQVVNPGVMQVLGAIAEDFPQYIRLDSKWVDELCDAASNHNMSARSNHHFYLAGGTQSGKSTLAGVLINKIAAKSQGAATVIGNDPKDGVTRWLCKFSRKFDGMEAIPDWIKFATREVDDRKQAIANQSGNCDRIPELFLVQDEVDSVFGGGKGFPGKVDKKTAEALQALWNYIIKFTAGLKCHGVFMGQSPLCGATGFSRPDLKNVCFIAMGQTASYILDNPKDFINVKDEILQVFQQTCELLDKASVRYALVVPTRSNPFVAIIPTFDIGSMEQKQDVGDAYMEIKQWLKSLERLPSDRELADTWKKLTGLELNEQGLSELKRILEI
ncbi:hypothetical protein PCC6912_40010 [Chlorogloeopsis fritschii PCC 6912]|uniref:FtsK domain-containing protein n=1 Tax=Chlorogloeopsis fritschii PCC 6912 TaxID=211165 RepID=A0A3S0ZPV0_CHLFR|nr:hypothetical protein PCC6912_40010 [Chlorogloeopsis fritschii PCC 6912]